ncbi:MAG: MucR family transcriptional regulator [Janthinobacterium lividum]
MTDTAAPASNQPALVEMTSEVVAAYTAKNHVQPSELPALIASVHVAFMSLGRPSEVEAVAEPLKPAVPVKKSVTDDYIISLEDGRKFRSLKRYLGTLGMTPADYRAKWGLPHNYPMVAPGYAARRSALAKSIGFGLRNKKAGVEAPEPAEVPEKRKAGRPKKGAA